MTKMFAAAVLSVFALAMAAPAFATDKKCKNCVAPRPHYDSQEVVRTTKDVDRSRVINTQSVVEVPSGKVRTRNHLVIRKNTIRNVGVVRHNHTIIEKEIRYKRRPRAMCARASMRRRSWSISSPSNITPCAGRRWLKRRTSIRAAGVPRAARARLVSHAKERHDQECRLHNAVGLRCWRRRAPAFATDQNSPVQNSPVSNRSCCSNSPWCSTIRCSRVLF